MNSLFTIILFAIIFLSFLLVLVIMVQNPKGGGLSSSFGGGDSQQLGGVKQTGDFLDKSTDVLIANMGGEEFDLELKIASQLRSESYSVELYPDSSKLKKQMKYANDKNIPYVVIIGEEERSSNKLTLKNMKNGDQKLVDQSDLVSQLN